MTHLMLDLETWGTRAGYDLRSIGATVFDPVTAMVAKSCDTCKGGTVRGNVNDGGDCSDCMNTRMESGYGDTFYLATDNPVRPDARPQFSDPNDPNADRKYMLHRDPKTIKWWSEQSPEAQAAFTNPVDLRDALGRFAEWLPAASPDVHIWAHGSHFDVPILEAAYHAVDLPVPWHYRSPCDTRTIFDAAKIDDHSGWLDMFSTGTHHHALDDAICQARAVCAAFKVLRI